jgi:hypothetical protein
VVDRGHIEGQLYEKVKEIVGRYHHENKEEAEKAYLTSLISLKEYLEKQSELNYSLPEVVFTEDIPLERVRVSEIQPNFEDEIREHSRLSPYSLEQIGRVSELQEWYEKRGKKLIAEIEANQETREKIKLK